MLSPRSLLPLLIGAAIAIGGIMQGVHWRSTSPMDGTGDGLRLAREEIAMLRRENESLRSLAQGGGGFSVPQELVARVEREFGLRFRSSPVVNRLPEIELRDRIAAAIESEAGPSGIDYRQDAYRLIGWLGPDDDLLEQLASVRAVGARAWFDAQAGEGWLTDRFEIQNIPDQAALIRLLSRILLQQNFPIWPDYPGDDAARARDALFQGAAAGAETRFFAANAREIGFLPVKDDTGAGRLLAALPPFIQGLVNFTAIEGKTLADSLYLRGNPELHEALRKPPATTRAVVFPAQVEAAAALEMPAVPEEPFLAESAGLLGLRLWLEQAGDASAALEISSAWRNDRYLLFPEGEAGSALVWDIELDATAAAEGLEAAARDLIAAMSALSVPPAEKRFLRISRPSPTRVRFLNTASQSLSAGFP